MHAPRLLAEIANYSRFRLRFLAAAILALALSATALDFLTAGDPVSPPSLSALLLLLLTALAPPLAVNGVGLQVGGSARVNAHSGCSETSDTTRNAVRPHRPCKDIQVADAA